MLRADGAVLYANSRLFHHEQIPGPPRVAAGVGRSRGFRSSRLKSCEKTLDGSHAG
ncbi:hypothetical protein [Pyrobaculum ferrireducens]|uniref:Uncharacterized protein n=1 Tax=Pyrobaculum ferrireducens TaxID=1104324 RepID=G7VFC3_9CREN|nr:hypothetical protein [Pyrobaculum ferrireducens]AET32929.1 hypothetical protein P186_1510 [Pyrobaculum ferrireducens]